MEPSEAKLLLLKASAIWTHQPTDDAVQAEWAECLARVSFRSALETVRDMRDSGRADAPTPGEIYYQAAYLDGRRRAYMLALVEPKPTEAEKVAARATLHEITERIGRRV
jgi:hypothetical protein